MCLPMASPSRSGSVATYTVSADFAASLISLTTFSLPGITSYVGSKLFSMSTPRPFFGKSLMWPTDAMTLKSLPRYLLIVFAFDGDSTITSDLDITHSNVFYAYQGSHNNIEDPTIYCKRRIKYHERGMKFKRGGRRGSSRAPCGG